MKSEIDKAVARDAAKAAAEKEAVAEAVRQVMSHGGTSRSSGASASASDGGVSPSTNASSGQPGPAVSRVCEACGVSDGEARANGRHLQQCSRCKRAFFCGRACQQAAWGAHKSKCTQ